MWIETSHPRSTFVTRKHFVLVCSSCNTECSFLFWWSWCCVLLCLAIVLFGHFSHLFPPPVVGVPLFFFLATRFPRLLEDARCLTSILKCYVTNVVCSCFSLCFGGVLLLLDPAPPRQICEINLVQVCWFQLCGSWLVTGVPGAVSCASGTAWSLIGAAPSWSHQTANTNQRGIFWNICLTALCPD